MRLKLAHMLSTSVLHPGLFDPEAPLIELIVKDAASDPAEDPVAMAAPEAGNAHRTRIWEFSTNLHCSIIGTCLTTAELRQVLDKLKLAGAAAASEHDLHIMGVTVAARRENGAKFLQKALDRRHCTAITRFAEAKDGAAVLTLWSDALKQGDIPGAYWAALTHPMTTEDIVKHVFGDVHMLSHLVGAANRADIRRLRELEQQNAELTAKIERQQRQLQEGFARRDQTIRRLTDILSQRTEEQTQHDAASAVDHVIRDLNQRLASQSARAVRSEQRVADLVTKLKACERALEASEGQCAQARRELELIERHLAAVTQPEPEETLRLPAVTLLYVGGRAHQVPLMRQLTESTGATFVHHDGGIEHSLGLLSGLVSRADHVMFPVDCISHDAVAAVKRLCRQTGKAYEPLRTTSLACLLSALVRLSAVRTSIAAE
jgi:hypothetical protein